MKWRREEENEINTEGDVRDKRYKRGEKREKRKGKGRGWKEELQKVESEKEGVEREEK